MRLAIALIGLAFAAGCVAASVRAAPDISYGIQDDAWLAHGPGLLDDRLDQLEALGVDIVRVNLHWDQIEPTQGSYAWDDADEVLQALHGRGIPAVVGLVGSPPWANGGKASNFVPTSSRFAGFAREAAERYPWVRDWLIWNEPNQTRWLRPTSPAVYVAHLLNPAYRAIHDVTPGAKVGGGVTAPRAGAGGVSPVAWIRGMRRAGARLDAYAHHPYPARPTETPLAGGCGHCSTRARPFSNSRS